MTIQLTDITKTYADRRVLDGIHLTVPPGSRTGLVGENGAGKSTLLRIAAGVDPDFGGAVRTDDDLAYVAQDSGIAPASTVAEVMHEALSPLHRATAELTRLADRLDEAGAATAYDRMLAWCEWHGAWDADRRAEIAAHRLGLEPIPATRTAGSLSGGQQSRLALAAMIVRQPACVILDEPTNHLDDEALDFLADELRTMRGSVLVASHDRVFLDRVCTAIVDLDPSHFGTDGDGGRLFTGSYTAYLGHKRDARQRWEEAFAAEQEELAALRIAARTSTGDVAHNRGPRDNDKFIYGFKGSRVQATAARRSRNAQQRISVIERDPVPKPPEPLTFRGRLHSGDAGSADLRDVTVTGRLGLRRLTIDPGDKVLVTGANGAGKSTLLSVIAGRIRADRGSVRVTAGSIGLLTQDVQLTDLSRSATEAYADALRDERGGRVSPTARAGTVSPSGGAGTLRQSADSGAVPLRRLGLLHPRDLHRPLGELSLGQQRRLELAVVIARRPDLVLLDEPTNHLSLTLVDELEEALRVTDVTVVLASHDRWIRRRWHGREVPLPS